MYTIESERARQRMSEAAKAQHFDQGRDSSPTPPLRTRDVIGTKLGVGGKHVEAAASVVKTADNLRANGRCLFPTF